MSGRRRHNKHTKTARIPQPAGVARFMLRLGRPQMEAYWTDLVARHKQGQLSADEQATLYQVSRAMDHLRNDPRHPGLQSHEIAALTRRYGQKVFQSYVENATPGARRLFWVYGPAEGEITVIGLEPHPEDDKNGGYERVQLDKLPTP